MTGMDLTGANAAEGRRAVPLGSLAQSQAGVVHDLGNLIQVALSGLNLIARDPALSYVPELQPVVIGARAALNSAGALVRETVGEDRKNHLRDLTTDVGDCLTELRTLSRTVWTSRIELKARVETGLPRARCDRLGLQNAVLNLLFNARDAMPDGGQISVTAATCNEGPPAWIELRVEDSGIGMTPETVRRAFEPFFTTKGTGLGGVGLPMVRRFVEESGGSIHIESTLGSGTAVVLRLPSVAI